MYRTAPQDLARSNTLEPSDLLLELCQTRTGHGEYMAWDMAWTTEPSDWTLMCKKLNPTGGCRQGEKCKASAPTIHK